MVFSAADGLVAQPGDLALSSSSPCLPLQPVLRAQVMLKPFLVAFSSPRGGVIAFLSEQARLLCFHWPQGCGGFPGAARWAQRGEELPPVLLGAPAQGWDRRVRGAQRVGSAAEAAGKGLQPRQAPSSRRLRSQPPVWFEPEPVP